MLRGSKALVTGATRGIGYAIAEALAAEGCSVVITGRREETVRTAAERIGRGVIPMVWDVTEPGTAQAKLAEARDAMGGLDICVNNAGVITDGGEWGAQAMLGITCEEWRRVTGTNLDALFFCMQAEVKDMLGRGVKGNILNVTSVAGYEPVYGPYGASKTAATGLTRGWGKTFAPKGIVINGIAPGPVATEMNGWHEGDPMEHGRIPFGRFARADEIASLALYLLSDGAAMVCGETVVLDGAYNIR